MTRIIRWLLLLLLVPVLAACNLGNEVEPVFSTIETGLTSQEVTPMPTPQTPSTARP